MNLIEAIEERRARIAQLQAEVDQLEQARQLVAGVLDGEPVKPPPRAKKERAVRAEAPATGKRPRTKPGDTHFASCGHPNTAANHTSQKKCKQCVKDSNARYQAKLAAKSGRTPKVKAEPDPVRPVLAPKEPPRPAAIAVVEVTPIVTVKKEGRVLDEAERARLLKMAERWKGQCSAVDTRGQRCGLLHPHDGPHNASGRPFTTVVPAGSALPRRELDELAIGSRP